MITRRFFIKHLLLSAWMLISCGMRRSTEDKKVHPETIDPQAITLTPLQGAVVQVECRFTRTLGAHPLQGALLCAIEAYRQVPRCTMLFKNGETADIKKERIKGGHRYRFEVDLDQALDLKGTEGLFFIHLACRQLRSAVIAYTPKRSANR